MNPPEAFAGQRVTGEPRRLRHELAWPVELPDGRRAVIAQLAPELAAQPALRRRWVADMERMAALPAARLAPTIKLGPEPDPRAVDAEPPWRVRLDPPGATLDSVLKRAPLPLDEAIDLGARLAEALHTLHAAGAVLRDLDPRAIVMGDDGQLWFTDVGHARLAILTSRTASSLLLESSPYVAAEALLGTVVDVRADVFSLGVVLWRALTGRVPFEASLLATRTELPDLAAMRADVPASLAKLVKCCLAHEPERRPPTARDVAAALRGRATTLGIVVERVTCQACGATLRAGLRLCLSCGKQAVQFHATAPGDLDGVSIVLDKAKEDATFVGELHEFFETVATSVPKLNFVIGDRRMYSKSELARRHKVPAVLVADLAPSTGKALAKRLADRGFKIRTTSPRKLKRSLRNNRLMTAGGGVAILVAAATIGSGAAPVLELLIGLTTFMVGLIRGSRVKAELKRLPIGQLRPTPAALPAGDAQVAAIASALAAAKAPDVRVRLEELASLVQRLCDANHALAGAGSEVSSAPIRPLVELAKATAEAIDAIDHQLATLDEGLLVRALARSEARKEPPALRAELLAGLDTLRQLEEQRATLFRRLLEITSLARVAIEHGLAEAAALRSDDIEVAHALASLDD